MKLTQFILCALLLTTGISAGSIRTWTSSTGKTLDGTFVKEKFNLVYIETADGSSRKINLSDLSKADQAWIKQKKQTSPSESGKIPKASHRLVELFGQELRNSRKRKVTVDSLAGKTIGVYFSAHWCPPCRSFTPVLVDFHNEMTKQGKPFEIVFVSSDHGKSEMYNYMKEEEMPWLAVDYDQFKLGMIKSTFGVSGIPKLVIIDDEGNIITENGRNDVSRLREKAFNEWSN